ncbi:MAG: carcinine hydrolase/isopenicillin-N N-acyltransferase family protein [Bacteroidota bacterium]
MAEGAAVNEKGLITLNLAEETMIYFSKGYQSCTNIGLRTDDANHIAYNLDLPDFLMKYKPVVLDNGLQLVYGFPGIIATGGMNSNFAVTTNSLPNLTMNLNGLPLPFMIRKLLMFSDQDEALLFLENTPLGAPQNIMIAGRKGIQDIERSANQHVRYEPPHNEQVVYHTNHPLVNTDFNLLADTSFQTCERFSYLDQVFKKTSSEDSLLNRSILLQSITNRESGIRYEGNYFSFLASYPTNPKLPPIIELLLPKSDTTTALLQFR